MILLALILSIQYDWANGGAQRTGGWQPNLVNSPSLQPYKDMIGGDALTPLAAAATILRVPSPARPNIPAAPLPPPPASPGASPSAGPPPSIAPTVSPPTNAPPASPGAFPSAGAGTPLSNAPVAPGPAPQQQGVWCVANPTVESADVQAAMDDACGSGADCDMAAPGGPCYLPVTLMAHASYAFNSYWQRTKLAGGAGEAAAPATPPAPPCSSPKTQVMMIAGTCTRDRYGALKKSEKRFARL